MRDFLCAMKTKQALRVSAARARTSEASLESRIEGEPLSLRDRLRRRGARFILECKSASPSEGVMISNFHPDQLARSYLGPADAISVLTEPEHFGGHLEHLARVKMAVDVPVLRKDFIVDPYQVLEARAFGADAVLLMVSLLEPSMLSACLREATRLGMEALVEAHDAAEMDMALAAGTRLLGINNRDLRTMEVRLGTVDQLSPRVPDAVTVVAESGYRNPADILAASPRVDGFLVGTQLVKAPDPGAEARRLAFGRIKICGLTRLEDAQCATALGASHLGFVRWEGSRRWTSDLSAFEDVDRPKVGVYVDPTAEQVKGDAERYGLSAVQIHGRVPRGLNLPVGVELWGGVSALKSGSHTEFDRLVLDSAPVGGTGKTFDWNALDWPDLHRHWLAGGIGPDNVQAARQVGTFGIDLSSGVERAPGIKDSKRLVSLFEKARAPSRSDAHADPDREMTEGVHP
ncbi:MAG: bifunctional indole-3-glycerol-phosphate synthase TrpC/phosphoribosylanthranilate isomerase TrpF [Myxococcota bacterium]